MTPDAPLDRTGVDTPRPITVRHLLTCTSGWGISMAETPVRTAMIERACTRARCRNVSGDEFVATVAALPLAFPPGEGWLYDTGIDLLGVLLARATGQPLSELIAERVTRPLGMADNELLDRGRRPPRTGTCRDPTGSTCSIRLTVCSRGAAFEKLSGGLVSTAPDLLRFYSAMADGGAPVLTSDSVAR